MGKEFPNKLELDLLQGNLVGVNGDSIRQTNFTDIEKELLSTCAPTIVLGGKFYSRTEYIAKIEDKSILKKVTYEAVPETGAVTY